MENATKPDAYKTNEHGRQSGRVSPLQALIAMSTLTPIAVSSITGTRLTCSRRASWCQQLRGYAATAAQGFELEVLSQFLGMVLNAISDSFMTPPRSGWAFTLDE